jgi:hypothetical protein
MSKNNTDKTTFILNNRLYSCGPESLDADFAFAHSEVMDAASRREGVDVQSQ